MRVTFQHGFYLPEIIVRFVAWEDDGVEVWVGGYDGLEYILDVDDFIDYIFEGMNEIDHIIEIRWKEVKQENPFREVFQSL